MREKLTLAIFLIPMIVGSLILLMSSMAGDCFVAEFIPPLAGLLAMT
jgi:hypothetical protein